MKIYIKSPGTITVRLIFPTRMLFNRLTAAIAEKLLKEHAALFKDADISSADLRRLAREVNRMKKKHPHLCLVHVESAGGDIVKIYL